MFRFTLLFLALLALAGTTTSWATGPTWERGLEQVIVVVGFQSKFIAGFHGDEAFLRTS